MFSRLCIQGQHSLGNPLSSSVIITCNIEWKQAGHQLELPSDQGRIAEPGLIDLNQEYDVNIMLFLEYIHLQGLKGCPEGRRASFIGMSICFTWYVSELISSTKCGAVMIYEKRGLLNFGCRTTELEPALWSQV